MRKTWDDVLPDSSARAPGHKLTKMASGGERGPVTGMFTFVTWSMELEAEQN